MKEHVCMKCGKILESDEFDRDDKVGNATCHVCLDEQFKNNPKNARTLLIAEGLIIILGVVVYFLTK